jgi:pyrroloquinoline quinone biosynthesis protein E
MLPNPLALIAEVTHRCPLHCVYCSNPLEMAAARSELPTDDWIRVFSQAAEMKLLHLHLTGGEPLARADLKELIAAAHTASLYTNLITSGIGLTEPRLAALIEAGLDHIQLSFQDSREDSANWIAGTRAHAHKLELARIIRKQKIAFTINLVVHRQNLDHLDEMIALIEVLNPDRMEIAHAQYYGWALQNRAALMPTREQLEKSVKIVDAARERLQGRIRVDSVTPDYYARYPKACMGGWGQRLLLIDPAGKVLPCHAAGVIPDLHFDNVREHSLQWIWEQSPAFQRFRGESWMQAPCRTCDRRTEDFGGCRCQAFLLTGDAAATDPVCSLAPTHHFVEAALLQMNTERLPISNPVNVFSRQLKNESDQQAAGSWLYRKNPA